MNENSYFEVDKISLLMLVWLITHVKITSVYNSVSLFVRHPFHLPLPNSYTSFKT